MRLWILILFALFFSKVNAQAYKTKSQWVRNAGLQSFVANAKDFYALRFTISSYEGLELRPDPATRLDEKQVYGNTFSMNYLGHRYLFEKTYGRFPDSLFYHWLDSFRSKRCEYNSFTGVIYPDSIHISHTIYCPQEAKDEDRIFFKIPNEAAFLEGPSAFNAFLSRRLTEEGFKNPFKVDTAIFLRVLIWPDSVAHEVRNLNWDALYSEEERMIEKVLLNTRLWKPAIAGGRVVKSSLQIFIRFRKDGTVEADYFH